jgi:uncharacterized membrane protein
MTVNSGTVACRHIAAETGAAAQTRSTAAEYSCGTLILLFFTYSLIGGAWEYILRFAVDGKVVNSGVLHGPWLPIYSVCGVAMLTVLNRHRDKPVRVFFSVMGISAVIEYASSWLLERFLHTSWWDYSAYTFNLHGRICLEALLLFSVLGCISVYYIAPGLNTVFGKVPTAAKTTLAVVLIALFAVDLVYSLGNPNMSQTY